jgi:gliding motility-associated-like protein
MYIVTGTDANGCSNIDSVAVSLKTKTTAVVGEGGEICRGESVQLSASGALQYAWSPASGLNNHLISDPLASPPFTTTYMVIASEGSCIPDTGFVEVIVHQLPSVDAGPDQTIVAGEVAQLQGSGTDFTSYSWSPGEFLNCTDCLEPQATPKQTTTFSIVAYNDFGCSDSDQVTIFVICKESQVFMPNSFTPNNDGQNDRFYARGKGIQVINSFRIYNRWGELVFERRNVQANDYNNAWDGTYNGILVNPDVFIYVIDAVCDTGEPVSWKGDISLIR